MVVEEAGTSPEDNSPEVSVIVCAYNSGERIRATIDAILGQSFTNFELLVLDDGSTDNTVEILNGYQDARLKVIVNEQNLGVAQSRNKGLSLSRGSFIATCDHDDVWLPHKLAEQLAYMEAHPECGVVSSFWGVSRNGVAEQPALKSADKCEPKILGWCLFRRAILLHSSLMMRASVLAGHDIKYREGYPFADDWLICHEFLRASELGVVQKILLTYHYTGKNWSVCATDTMHQGGIDCLRSEIGRLLGREIGPGFAEDYFRCVVLGEPAPSKDCLMDIGQHLYDMAETYISQYGCNDSEARAVRHDAAEVWWEIVACSTVYGNSGLSAFYEGKARYMFQPSGLAKLWVHMKALRQRIKG